jgi:hypothetical protein
MEHDESSTFETFADFTLEAPDAVDQAIFGGPGAVYGGTEADIELKKIRLRIGRRPTVRNMRKLYELLALPYPSDFALFSSYDVWMFSFKVHLLRDGGFQTVRQFGCQVKYPEDEMISIVAQLPESAFIRNLGGSISVSADLGATGEATVPQTGWSAGDFKTKISADLRAAASAKAELNLSFSVMTTSVIATGTADFVGEWSIRRTDAPLLGEQIFVHTLLIPKEQKALNLQLRAYVAVDTLFMVPARLNSEWVNINAPLVDSGVVGTASD